MGTEQFARTSRLMRGLPAAAVVAALTAAALGGASPAAAAYRDVPPAPRAGQVPAGTISTVAGGVGGPARATKVFLFGLCGVTFGAGHLYVTDFLTVRAVDPVTGRLTTPAGTGAQGPQGIGGRATNASLDTCGTAVDHSGNLVIAEGGDVYNGTPPVSRVLVAAGSTGTFYGQAMKAGHIYAVAGSGKAGFSGDGGPALGAELDGPARVAVDAAGNLVIADTDNNRIRVVAEATGTFYGQAMTAGDIYTVAGGGTGGLGDGGPATSAMVADPVDVRVDATGNLVIADYGYDRIRVVADKTGTFYGQAMTAGDIYTIAGTGADGFSGDGGPAISAELNEPIAAALDAAGNVVIADRFNNRIRVVAAKTGTFYGVPMTAGDIYTVAGGGTRGLGNGGPATSARIKLPMGVTVDGAGNLVIANDHVREVRVVAATTGTFYGVPMTAGHIYPIAGSRHSEFPGNGGPPTHAQFQPSAVTADAAGDLLIAEANDARVQMVPAASGRFYGVSMTAGRIYTIAGDGTCHSTGAGDGGPAVKADLCAPEGAGVDTGGNLLIADSGNSRIRVVAGRTGTFYGQAMTVGHIYTIAGGGTSLGDGGPATSAELSFPSGVAPDAAGNLLIADSDDERIRVVAESTGTFYGHAMTAGDIYTIAGDGTEGFSGDGGPATKAQLEFPSGVALDAAGNVLIADNENNRIRVVAGRTGTFYGQAMTVGHIYTVAGGNIGGLGDGGPATRARLDGPAGVTVDPAGNLVVADTVDNRIRVVAESSGTFYGVSMTAGDIYTVAGKGPGGNPGRFSGDGGPATKAELAYPFGAAVNAAGNLLIADTDNGRIRMVTG